MTLARRLARLAPRVRDWLSRPTLRIERFGAIVHMARPRALVFVDRAMAKQLGAAPNSWPDDAGDGDVPSALLSAPLEAHLQITNRCSAGCKGCYTGATPAGNATEWGLGEWKTAVDTLADMGVFHLALGGGESLEVPWLGELAQHARDRGLVPNLTTSGLVHVDRLIEWAPLFGQVNVSLDGLGDTYAAVRGFDGFDQADEAIQRLRRVMRNVGINVVVTRHNYDQLEAIFRYARSRKLSEVELLRFKPSGRGKATFAGLTCSDAQYRQFLPTILAAAKATRVRVKVDCSFTPMLAHHDPGFELMKQLAVYGCVAGDYLVGAKATGLVTACSFAPAESPRSRVTELGDRWQGDLFPEFRKWRDAEEPCRSCTYLPLCRGGCKVVSAHLAGDPQAPDPECPRVIDHPRSSRPRLPVLQ